MFIKFCFTDWLHDLQYTLLYNPVYDTRYTQRSKFPIWFGNLYPPYCFWHIPCKLFLNKRDEIFFWHICQGFYRSPICAGGMAPIIAFNISESKHDVIWCCNDFYEIIEYFSIFAFCIQFIKDVLHVVVFRMAQFASFFSFLCHVHHPISLIRVTISYSYSTA